MNRRWYTLATWLMWLALPLTAWSYLRVWDRLPLRMAVHFDVNWQPNGFTSRQGALYLGLGIMAFMVLIFTIAAYAARATKPAAAWPLMVLFYLSLTGLWLVNNWIAQRNLNAQSAASAALCPQFSPESDAARLMAAQPHL